MILDIYSRYVVGWMVATRESAALAEKLIAATCAKQGITRGPTTGRSGDGRKQCHVLALYRSHAGDYRVPGWPGSVR